MITLEQMRKGARAIANDVLKVARRELDFIRIRPTVGTLFLTYRCNSSCRTCTAWKRSEKEEIKKEIGVDEWKLIIDKLAESEIKVVEIFGGNVLLRKSVLIPLLKYLREKKFTVHLPTNQIGLDDDIAAAIVSCVDFLYISIDGVGEYQDTIRGQKGASQRVGDTLGRLIELRGNAKTPRLMCNTTVSKFNVNILDKIVEYACSLGADEIYFEYVGEFAPEHIEHSMIGGIKPSPYYVKQDESVLVDQEGARRLREGLREIKKVNWRKGVNIFSANIDVLSARNLYEGTIPHGKCYVERNEVTVDPYGNIAACPFINNYIMGSLVNSELADIWNNDKHRLFRAHQNGGKLAMCPHCILGVQRNPGIYTSLRRIYFTRIQPVIYRTFL